MTTGFSSVAGFWRHYVPTYKSGSYSDFFVRMPWTEQARSVARSIRKISERRSTNRITSYVDPAEIERVRNRLGRTVIDRNVSKTASRGIRISEKNDEKILRNSTGSRYLDARASGFKTTGSGSIRKKHARDVSIRFGVRKLGHGYGKERGDFCLVSAVLVGRKITFFYRSIELIGGFAFDLVLIEELERLLEVEFTEINIWAKKAFIFALKGNSNQKLFPKLQEIMRRVG